MVSFKNIALCFWMVLFCYGSMLFSQTKPVNNPWYFESLKLPKLVVKKNTKPIVIAIIDDGFRLSHQMLQPFWQKTDSERSKNRMDDDDNGFADDYCGWDFADGDNDGELSSWSRTNFLSW